MVDHCKVLEAHIDHRADHGDFHTSSALSARTEFRTSLNPSTDRS